MNTDYLQGYIDALKEMTKQIDAVMSEAIAKAKEDKDKQGFESFAGGAYIALLMVGEKIARATAEQAREVMAK